MSRRIDEFARICTGARASIFIDSRRRGGLHIREYVERGWAIPDHLLPGRYIMRMPKETRDMLKTLTSDEVNQHRVDKWLISDQ